MRGLREITLSHCRKAVVLYIQKDGDKRSTFKKKKSSTLVGACLRRVVSNSNWHLSGDSFVFVYTVIKVEVLIYLL